MFKAPQKSSNSKFPNVESLLKKHEKTDNNFSNLHTREATVMMVMILPHKTIFENSEPIQIITMDSWNSPQPHSHVMAN